jgi:iron-sulfur cluster assembly protein
MSITLKAAADRVKAYLRGRAKGEGLRFGAKANGCSGDSYVVNYADEIGPEDHIFENNGVKVVVDAGSLDIVSDTEIDYVKTGLNEPFQFDNPKAKDTCGCGESFGI